MVDVIRRLSNHDASENQLPPRAASLRPIRGTLAAFARRSREKVITLANVAYKCARTSETLFNAVRTLGGSHGAF
jgi:hypothetical protein